MSTICATAGVPPRPEKVPIHIVATIISRSERTARRLVEFGVLPGERDGKRRWLVPRAEAERIKRERGLSWSK